MSRQNQAALELNYLKRDFGEKRIRKFNRYNYAVKIYKQNGVFLGTTENISEEGFFLVYNGLTVDFEQFMSLRIQDPKGEFSPILGIGELRWKKTIDGLGFGIRFQATNKSAMRHLVDTIILRTQIF